MRALVYRGPWQLDIDNLPDPTPGPGDVLLRILATGIWGSDLHGFTGENGRRFPGQVMGHETAARVVACGSGISGLEGALVTVNPVLACHSCPTCAAGAEQRCPNRTVIGVAPQTVSAFAELLVVPARNVVTLPPDAPEDVGALVEPLAVGYHAVRRAGEVSGAPVVVIGGGPIGQAVALAARRLGVGDLLISEPSPSRRQLVRDLGLKAVDPETESRPAPGSADVVIDAVGSRSSAAAALEACAEGGRIVLVGMQEPQLSIEAYRVSVGERQLIGSYCYSDRHFLETAEWVAANWTGLDRLVEGRVPLEQAPAAFSRLARGEDVSSKVLVEMAD